MNGPDANGWMPIESAPKDGRWILVIIDGEWMPGVPFIPNAVIWGDCPIVDKAGWLSSSSAYGTETLSDARYTHWQPLPKPPVHSEDSQMSTLVEAMARAISSSEFTGVKPVTEAHRRAALAALEAIREPTGTMIRTACPMVDDEAPVPFVKNMWRAMIDAAIQEHSTTPPRNAS